MDSSKLDQIKSALSAVATNIIYIYIPLYLNKYNLYSYWYIHNILIIAMVYDVIVECTPWNNY